MKDEKSVKRRALFYVEHVISLRRDMNRLMGVFVVLVSAFMFAGQAVAQNGQEQPKKINERPVVASATPLTEPFDGATVEKMSGQCVKLDTEAGEIEIEMLAEAAPENVRNFLNLAATGRF